MSDRKAAAGKIGHTLALVRVGLGEARRGLDQSLEAGNRSFADLHYGYLWRFREIEQELDRPEGVEDPAVPAYVMGSLFLEQCKEALTRDEKEAMVYVSGVEVDGYIYLTDVLALECSQRSIGSVHGDDRSVLQAVLKLQRAGQRLFAWFHSHPGGRDACAPSGTDLRMQQRLEGLNYPAIGGIFTRDGYLRFFAAQRQFQIQIHGKGVYHVDPATYLYKINLPD